MAIAVRAVGANATGTSSLSVAEPTGTANGDLLVAFINDHATSGSITPPTNWTAIPSASGTDATGRTQVFWASKTVVGATSPWTFSGLTTKAQGVIIGLTGADLVNVPDVAGTVRFNAAGATGTTSITPITDGCMVIAMFSALANNVTWSAEALVNGPTLVQQFDGQNGTSMSLDLATGVQTSAAATGASSATQSLSRANVGSLLAFRPATSSVVAEEDSWWSPVMHCGARIASAAVVAASLLSTSLGTTVANSHQDDPAGLLRGQAEEDFWKNPVAPVPATLVFPQQAAFDEQIPAGLFGQPDEDYWQNPTPPIPATLQWPQQWTFSEEPIVPQVVTFTPEEDYWQNPVAPQPENLTWPQQYQFDTPEDVTHVDEDFWINPVVPLAATNIWPQPWQFEAQEASGTLYGQPDEDYWANPTPPVPATLLYPSPASFDEQIPAGSLVAVPTYSRAITIDHTKVGGSDLTNYVALVKGTYPYLATVANGGLVQDASGFDVIFYSDSALTSRLFWQVESYDPTTGEVVYWVRLPSVSHTVDTTFYIAYGSAAITTDQSNSFLTWFFVGSPSPVYHLNNASFVDSGGNTYPAVGQNSPTSGVGQIGTGAVFNGTNQNAYVAPAANPGGVILPTVAGTPSSVSFWVELSSFGGGYVLYQDGVGHNNIAINVPGSISGTFGLELGSNPGVINTTLKNDFLLNTLYKIDLTWNASNLIAIYVNGILDNSYAVGDSTFGGPGWSTTIASYAFGGTPTTGNFFAGLLDELRVYPQANSADFITCSYNNEASPSTFYSIGQERPGQSLEDDSWWSSVMHSGARIALATALSTSAMTGVANHQPIWQDEVPQTATTLVMEEDAAYLPPPIPATLQYPQQWSFDTPEDIAHIDEDYWATPAAVQATNLYPQQWPFDERIPAGNLSGQPDEDYWRNSVAPVVASLTYPAQWTFDEQIPISSPVEEDYWVNPVAPVVATLISPAPASFDEQIPAGSLSGQPDEDYWSNPVVPVVASLTYPAQGAFDEQIPAGNLSGIPEEDFWKNPVAPVPATLISPAPASFDEQIPANLSGQPDEDFWQNQVPPVTASLIVPQQWTFDEQIPSGLSGVPEEDYWQNPTIPAVATLLWPQQYFFHEEIPAGTLFGQADEDYWQNQVPPVIASLYQPLPLDDPEEIPAGSLYGVPDTDVWINPVAPVQAALSIPQQWAFDSSDIDFTEYDEDFWNNPVPPVQLTFASLPQWAFDPQDVPASFVLDEDVWSNPTPPVQLSFLLLQPSTFEQNDSPTLSGQPDEDYWTNPVAPVQAELRLLQPFLFEQNETVSTSTQAADEDYWQNQVSPLQAVNLWPQPFNFEQNDPTTLYGVPEDDLWVNPAPLQPLQNIVFSVVDDDFVAPVSLGEDYWINPASSLSQTNTPIGVFSDDEVPVFLAIEEEPWLLGRVNQAWLTPIRPLWVDGDEVENAPAVEDYWQNSVAPVQAKLRHLIPSDEALPSFSTSIEDYWFRFLTQKPADTNTIPKQWAFDEAESPSGISNIPVIVEMFSVLDIITSDGEFVDIVKAVSFTVQNLPTVVDISCVDYVEADNFRVGDVVEIIMPIPLVIAYTQLNEKYLTLGPVLETLPPNLPIVGATVIASLYANRSFGVPGTVVPQLHNLVLADQGEGVYQGLMSDPSFDPAPGQFYTTVIDLTGGGAQGHWEIPSVVLPRIS